MLTNNEREYLHQSMKRLLTEYRYTYNETILYDIIDEWAYKKSELIDAFKRHPNYVDGQFMIAFDSDYNRDIDKMVSRDFSSWIYNNCLMQKADSVPAEIRTGYISEGRLPYKLYDFLCCDLYYYAGHTIDESTADLVNSMIPSIRARAGQRMSSIINKICTYLGYNSVDGYNREYAKYADSLSPLCVTRHTVLSINPLDYLTMSFGNSWASCHTIDKDNIRNMPDSYSGAYSSGTMSYMLDSSSMVLYTIDKNYEGTEYWTQPKINRQMFHWGEDKLVQGRLYPQANDGNGEAYKPYRNIVQSIISTIFEFDNMWRVKKGTENASAYIRSCGTHYRDYRHYSGCNLSIVTGSENTNTFIVGSDPICIECGERHSVENNINCCAEKHYCPECGEYIDFDHDNYVQVGTRYYHDECCNYCDHCERHTPQIVTYVESIDGYVCEDCLYEHYTYCYECDSYHSNSEFTYVESAGRYVCNDCLENRYHRCEVCGRYYRNRELNTVTNTSGQEIHVCIHCRHTIF